MEQRLEQPAEMTPSEDDDVRERLLPIRSAATSPSNAAHEDAKGCGSDDEFSHEELMHSIGSFSAVVLPVTITMLLASVASLNILDPDTAAALANAYLVYSPDESDASASDGTKLEEAVINALAIVSFFLVATFVIVFCYKYNFTRMLIGYMMFSSAMLLGLLGGHMATVVIGQLHLTVDVITMLMATYNFAVVGVVAIFYQKGVPMWLTQVYLVFTSVIMAWQLGQFPEWTTWALVVVLAFYDLCAVLTPCGPLKWLVNLVQQEGRPLPGLLYEAEIRRAPTPGSSRPPTANQAAPSGYDPVPASSGSASPTAHQRRTVSANKYYQCEADIPMRTDSRPGTSVTTQMRGTVAGPTGPSQETGSGARLRQRLIAFYEHHNPSAIHRVDHILERYKGREDELWQDLHQKYYEDDGDDSNTIKLGLGDFVFYSVLVSRAAQFDFSAMIASLVTVLMGLGGTLFLLGVYKKALPALPISILLAVTVYFWLRGVFVEFASQFLDLGIIA
ncbi:TPA: hypothetical protein N0F65_003070 [Lagenidium giganteum]|uniref:Presenilin n=1 Tax=Lagenidium giganteum TaxID=4803 RepID=A0AAV2YLR8_9STRA|nr:TPA: hypothetical protein N0F65_003070 [Lagenidium giganteum]